MLFLSQERVIEQLKEKREKEEWTKQGEMEVCKKENKELKDKIASLQTQLLEKEVSFHMVKGHGLKVRTVTDVTNLLWLIIFLLNSLVTHNTFKLEPLQIVFIKFILNRKQ